MQPEQGTDEWKRERAGKVTASRVADVIAKTKTGWGASRANYAAQLIAERLTGQPQDTYQSPAMLWGIQTEPQARAAYEFFSGNTVEAATFILHPKIAMSGCSPDGLVGSDGLLEIKCPNTSTHIETLLGESIEKKYTLQMQWQMECTGRAWCDFVSFDPRLPSDLQLRIQRIIRDQSLIDSLSSQIQSFLDEIEKKVEQLQQLRVAA